MMVRKIIERICPDCGRHWSVPAPMNCPDCDTRMGTVYGQVEDEDDKAE